MAQKRNMLLLELIGGLDSGWCKNRTIILPGQVTEAIPESGSNKHVLFAVSGDWEQINQSAEVEELVDWLKEFGVAFLSD